MNSFCPECPTSCQTGASTSWYHLGFGHDKTRELYLKKSFSIFVKLFWFNFYSCSKQNQPTWHQSFHFSWILQIFTCCFCRILDSLCAWHNSFFFSLWAPPSFLPAPTVTNPLHVCADELPSGLSPGLHFHSVGFEGLIDLHLIHPSAEHYIYTSTLLSGSEPEGWEPRIKV